jgi:hypothetical protein
VVFPSTRVRLIVGSVRTQLMFRHPQPLPWLMDFAAAPYQAAA